MSRPDRSDSFRHGTPIEEAPRWALVLLAALFWLIAFPALAGLLAVWGLWRGQRLEVAAAALVLAVVVVAGLATRKPWRRRGPRDLHDERPLFARFSTWLWTTILVPNVLFGTLVLTRAGPPPSYEASLLLGLIVSGIYGGFALAAGARRRWRERGSRQG